MEISDARRGDCIGAEFPWFFGTWRDDGSYVMEIEWEYQLEIGS